MTKLRILFIAGLAITAALTVPNQAAAQAVAKVYDSRQGIKVGTTLCYSINSALSANQGTPLLTYISATSDKAGSALQFYNVTTNTDCNFVSTTTSIPVRSTNGIAVNDIIVLRHAIDDTYERRIVTTFTSATNLTVTVAPTVAMAVGDFVYRCATNGAYIPVGNATVQIIGTVAGIYAGQPNMPLLIDLDATSACQINLATARYAKPPDGP